MKRFFKGKKGHSRVKHFFVSSYFWWCQFRIHLSSFLNDYQHKKLFFTHSLMIVKVFHLHKSQKFSSLHSYRAMCAWGSPLVFSDLPIYLVENETFAGHLIIIGSQRAQVLSLPWLRSFPFLLNFELYTTIDSFLLARYLSPLFHQYATKYSSIIWDFSL